MRAPSHIAVVALALAAALLAPAPAAVAAGSSTFVVDLSEPGQGFFDQAYFEDEGVVFTEGGFVGFLQGDEALVGPVAGTVDKGFTGVTAKFAPGFQGTADYTLSAYSRSGRELGSSTLRVTQDSGDPESGPLGYATISLTSAKKATIFRLSSTFVRSSFPNVTTIDFGTSEVTIRGK